MTASLSLAQMVDLALGTPEVGAVNFNVLHTLLHALLGKLDLQDHKANINEADKQFLSSNKTEKSENNKDGQDSLKNILRAPYHTLQDKLMKMEDQLAILNDLPSNNELLSKVKARGDEDRYRPMTDLWQTMQISKRVGTNEEGIGKLMSLVEDMMGDMQQTREENTSLNKRIDELGDTKQFEEKLNQLEQSINDMKNQFSELPTDLVSWNALQDALSGIREEFAPQERVELAPQERVVIEMSSQTESRPLSGNRSVSRVGTPGPSNQLMDVLEKLGKLTDKHDVLEEKVTEIENELKNKADKSMLEGITGDVPSEILEQLKELQEQLNNLQKASDKVSKLQELIKGIEKHFDNLSENFASTALFDDLRGELRKFKKRLNELDDMQSSLQDAFNETVEALQGQAAVAVARVITPDSDSILTHSDSDAGPTETESTEKTQTADQPPPAVPAPVPIPKKEVPPAVPAPVPIPKKEVPPAAPAPVPVPKKEVSSAQIASLKRDIKRVQIRVDEMDDLFSSLKGKVNQALEQINKLKEAKNSDADNLSDDLQALGLRLTEVEQGLRALKNSFKHLGAKSAKSLHAVKNSLELLSIKCDGVEAHRSDSASPEERSPTPVDEQQSLSKTPSRGSVDEPQSLSKTPSRESVDEPQSPSRTPSRGSMLPRLSSLDQIVEIPETPENEKILSMSEQKIRLSQSSFGLEYKEKLSALDKKIDTHEGKLEWLSNDIAQQIAKMKEDLEDQIILLKDLVVGNSPISGVSPEMWDLKDSPKDDSGSATVDSGLSADVGPTQSDPCLHYRQKLDALELTVGDLRKNLTNMKQEAYHHIFKIKDNLTQMETELAKALKSTKSKTTLPPIQPQKDFMLSTLPVNMDNDAMSKMQQVLLELQADVDRLNSTSQSLLDDAEKKQETIKVLSENYGNLEDKKADKEFVHMEVIEKADKAHLEGKVSRTVFNDTCDELNKMIKNLLDKLTGHEDDWKKALSQLSDDVDGKLDRLEFGPIKDQLERELRALSKKIQQLSIVNYEGGDEDAAGIKKQLLRFHCISCDRPVDMTTQGPIPSIPAPGSLPATKSMRPYTTYELDAIRQQAKSIIRGANIAHLAKAVLHRYTDRARCGKNICNLMNSGYSCSSPCCPIMPSTQEISDMYATTRACGGPHTLTYPYRRITRMTTINNLFKEDEVPVPVAPVTTVYRDEMDIQGADGNVYKGRVDTSRLPNIQGTNQQGAPPARAQTSPSTVRPSPPPGHTAVSGSTRSPRPGSARLSRPPSSAEKRPASAQRSSMTEVPTGHAGSPAGGSPEPPTE